MSTCVHVVREILERNGLQRPDGRPLWGHRVTRDEHEALQQACRAELRPFGPIDAHVSAAFCMFAAREFCRRYDSGTWSWDDVLAAVGWTEGLSVQFYNVLDRGLRFWGRPLSEGARREYLRTLACEGGLPLGLLADSSRRTSLRLYFTDVLRAAERYGMGATELVERFAGWLPRTLRNETVFALTAELVDSVVQLRLLLPPEVADPVVELDRVRPAWRDEIPVRLDDDVALSLLRGLLRERRGESQEQRAPIELALTLSLEGGARFERRALVAPVATEGDLARLFGLDGSTLPSSFYLQLVEPDGVARPVAIATRVEGTDRFRLEPALPPRPIVRGPGVTGRVLLAASIGSRELGITEPPGGQPIPEDLPRVLEGTELRSTHRVRAFGSISSAGNAVLVALPASDRPTSVSGGQVERCEGVAPEGWRVWRILGEAEYRSADDVFRFRTGSAETPERHYEFVGRLVRFGYAGSEYWSGRPRVIELLGDARREVLPLQLEWRPCATPSHWLPWSDEPTGDIDLRVRVDGETRHRTRTCIMPPDFELSLPAVEQRAGSMVLRSSRLRGVRCDSTAEGFSATSMRESNGAFRLQIENAQPGASMTVDLLFHRGAEARFVSPCPVRWRGFVDRGGRPVVSSFVVAIDRLGTVRARAQSPRNERFVLEAKPPNAHWRIVAWLQPQHAGGLSELWLDLVESQLSAMLATTSKLDSAVQVQVAAEHGSIHPGGTPIQVKRYDSELCPIRDEHGHVIRVEIDDASRAVLGEDALGLLRVDARPLDQPDGAALELWRIDETSWAWPAEQAPAGPWLVIGWQDNWARLRPLLITQHGEPSAELDELQRAMRVEGDERWAALRHVAESCANDWSHESWPRIDAILGALRDLPPTTFDIVRHVTQVPAAAASALMRTSDPTAISVLWRSLEQMPFLWGAVPLRAWLQAAQAASRRADDVVALVEPTLGWTKLQALSTLTDAFAQHAVQQQPFMQVVREVLSRSVPHFSPPSQPVLDLAATPVGAQHLNHQMDEERQDFFRRNADARWPEFEWQHLLREETMRMAATACSVVSQGYRTSVLQAPALLAAISLTGEEAGIEALFGLRRARAFDPKYFDFAHAVSLALLLATNSGVLDDD
ncbi:MAG: hypothetical protein IT348_10990 [Candidatus Eisenbacteria bacterium]|nr:hypothetical protein [Candidatus Eisenbacteria bacterium]